MLVASVVYFQLLQGEWTTHELLISAFLFLTAPISANMIAKVHLHRLRRKELAEPTGPAGEPRPPSPTSDWATHEAPHRGTPGDFEGDGN
jgi:multicomponent K+:H+ antiporter subunit G